MNDKLMSEFDMMLCRRDYDLLAEHQPELLDILERVVGAGIDEQALRRWTLRRVQDEPLLVQRIMNASRYCGRNSTGSSG